MRGLAVLLVATGCGRIDFDFLAADGSDAGPQLACNAPIELGPLTDAAPSQGLSYWIASAATPSGLVVAYTSTAGVSATTIDLTSVPPVRGTDVIVFSYQITDLQVTATSDRIFVTGDYPGAMIVIGVTDLALAPISSRLDPSIDIGHPDHSAPRPEGGVVVIGQLGNGAELATYDDNGAFVARTAYPVSGVSGGSITPLVGGGYAAVWPQTNGDCTVAVIDDSLVQVASTETTACPDTRIAASTDGSRIGLSWPSSASVPMGATFDSGLTTETTPLALDTTVLAPTRTASGEDGFWTTVFVDVTTLHAVLLDPSGGSTSSVSLVPFSSPSNGYLYDAVGRGKDAYAVWLADAASADLYFARLCAP